MAVVDNERNLMTVLCNYDDDDAYDKELLPARTHKIYNSDFSFIMSHKINL